MLKFVPITHPDQIKAKKTQGTIRQHAIRTGISKSRKEQAKRLDNFIVTVAHNQKRQMARRIMPAVPAIPQAPSAGLIDPFDTLCGNAEKLRLLMRHRALANQAGEPVFCIDSSGIAVFQSSSIGLHGALADPTFFHAFSLILSLVANNNVPDPEILRLRGMVLHDLREAVDDTSGTPCIFTVTAILILIGYEYRCQDKESVHVAVHIRGVQASMKHWNPQYSSLVDKVQRALFWQDLISCLVIDTPRILTHRLYSHHRSLRDLGCLENCVVPSGFHLKVRLWPAEFAVVLEDLNALCWLVDAKSGPGDMASSDFPGVLLMEDVHEGYSVDNSQANIESRLVDLLSDSRHMVFVDPMYEACIFAAYLCTYKLSVGVWEGCFVPEFCVSQILQRISLFDLRIEGNLGLLIWMLLMCGGLTRSKGARTQVVTLLHGLSQELPQNWTVLQGFLQTYLWSENAMKQGFANVWKELHPEPAFLSPGACSLGSRSAVG